MKKIIGGEFKIELKEKMSSPDDNKGLFSSGRAAFFSILNSTFINNLEKVLLPDYLCSSITKTCIDSNIPYEFYHIKKDFLPDSEDLFSKINKSSVVLLISYFGIVSVEKIAEEIKKRNSDVIIIIDDVQSFYSTKELAFCDFRFNSYRKWFAVPDGAEIFCKKGIINTTKNINIFAQYKFSGNLLKNYSDWIDDNLCLELLNKGEKILDENYNCSCSDISKALIPKIPFEEIREKRLENANYLHRELEKMEIKHFFNDNSVPLFLPIFVNNRSEIRKELFDNNIFTPVHWPYESAELNGSIKNNIYDIELSLICDQRYSLEDMKREISVLKKCI